MSRRPFSLLRYLTVVVLFALGLMAKPMLVTLPFVLLLLDYWPLGRFAAPGRSADRFPSSGFPTGSRAPAWEPAIGVPQRELGNEVHSTVAWRLVIEKLPLLALSAASCVVTPLVQAKTVARLDFIPLWSRIANALVSYVAYARQLFFPQGLALFYPHPGATLPLWKAAGAALLLAGVSAAVVAWRRKYPYLLVGWLWYLGMLVPVIGLVQVGQQAMADRYTYLPEIGLVIALAWGAKRLLESWPSSRLAVGDWLGADDCGLDGLRLAAGVLLAGSRDTLEPHAGLHFGQRPGPFQSRRRAVRPRAHGRGH